MADQRRAAEVSSCARTSGLVQRLKQATFIAFAFFAAVSTGWVTFQMVAALLGEGWATPFAGIAFTAVILLLNSHELSRDK
jgi:hypothetical protein